MKLTIDLIHLSSFFSFFKYILTFNSIDLNRNTPRNLEASVLHYIIKYNINYRSGYLHIYM